MWSTVVSKRRGGIKVEHDLSLKKKEPKKVLLAQDTFVNSQRVQLKPIVVKSIEKIKPNKNETI